MAYAGDRLYKEVIRRRMGELASRINVREMLVHLPCLTLSDREEIEAKRDNIGNYGAVSLLLDNLQRRENWPDQFIAALQACEYSTLADEIGEAYDRIRGINTRRTTTAAPSAPVPPAASVPVSPAAPPAPAPAPAAAVPRPAPSPAEASATVTMAAIHNVPHSTPTLLTPSVSEASVPSATPSPINSPPGPYSNIPTPASTEAPALVSAPDAPVQPPPESAPPVEPPLLVLAPDVMPPSPVSAPKVTPSRGQSEVPVSSRETPQLGVSGGLPNTALSGTSSVAAPTLPNNPTSTSSQVNKPAPTSQSSASPEKCKVPVAVIERSSMAKHPIQDTNPPGTVLSQDSQNNPTVSQVAERVHTAVSPNCQTQETSQGTAQATPSASTGAVAGCLSNFAAQNEENFSKPGVLTEEEPARHQAISNPHRAEEPVDESLSVSSDDLMISSSTTTVQHVFDPTASVQNSTPRAQENNLPEGDSNSCPNQPVEDYYESLQTREHTVQIFEGPSVQNLNGQPPSMVGPSTIGLSPSGKTVMSVSGQQPSQGISQSIKGNNASKQDSPAADLTASVEPASANFQESELNASGQINIPRSKQRDESQGILQRFQSNWHLIAAATIGMTAVFVALRLRH